MVEKCSNDWNLIVFISKQLDFFLLSSGDLQVCTVPPLLEFTSGMRIIKMLLTMIGFISATHTLSIKDSSKWSQMGEKSMAFHFETLF